MGQKYIEEAQLAPGVRSALAGIDGALLGERLTGSMRRLTLASLHLGDRVAHGESA